MLTDASLGLNHWGSFMPSPEYQRVALNYVSRSNSALIYSMSTCRPTRPSSL